MLEAGALHRLLHLPLGVVVGNEVLRRLARAKGAHQDEPPDACVFRGRDEVAGALLHHALELLLAPLTDRHEVDDGVDVLDGASQAGVVRHLADDGPARQVARTRRVADEQLQVVSLVGERAHDGRADEAGAAGEENLHLVGSRSKFCQ